MLTQLWIKSFLDINIERLSFQMKPIMLMSKERTIWLNSKFPKLSL